MTWDESSGAKIIPKCILWMRGLVTFWALRHFFLSLTDCYWLYNIQLKTSRRVLFLSPSDAYVRSFLYLLYTLIQLYYTKALSDQASSLAPDWILLLQRPRIPASFHSATAFHLRGSSRILQDKVRILGALVLCSPSEHVFHCTLLTLWCGCVNEWNTLHEASEEPCSVVPWRPHTAYGRNLSGVYTDLPMPRGTQHLLRGPTRNGQSVWTELSFLGQTFWSLWPFHNSLGIRSTNVICWIIDFQGTRDLCCYCDLWLRSQTWIGRQEVPSLARNQK